MGRRALFRLNEIGRTKFGPLGDDASATPREDGCGDEGVGYRRYKGPVIDLQSAMFADMPVAIMCNSCSHQRQLHAFKVVQMLREKRKISNVPLGEPVAGFWCKFEKKSVTVTIRAPAQWAD
jgi:hypothetical protein